jgi:hypothetical protein
MSKNMEKALYEMINCLAEKHGFDPDEAFEYVRWETEIDHVGGIFKMVGAVEEEKVGASAPAKDEAETASVATSGGDDVPKKIAECKKNITLWEKKLGDGKVKDADKQREKITKEKAKLAKLEAKVGTAPVAPVAEEPKKVEEPVSNDKKETKKVEPKEKRIKRFSPVMGTQLTTALNGVGVTINDKLKKEFQQFIEDLGEDTYREKGLADHMRDFAKTKAPVTEVTKKTDRVEELVKEMDALLVEEKPASGPSNAAGGGPVVHKLSLKELQSIGFTTSVEPAGALWDADNGRFVEGPDSVADEDFEETKYDGKDYVVGVTSGRVYEVREKGDIFAGFCGVGKFKTMTMP